MDKIKLPAFDSVNAQLQQHDLLVSAADVHGVICGLMCGGIKLDGKAWLTPFDQLINEGFGIPQGVEPILKEIYDVSEATLKDISLGFELLIPDMEQPIEQRLDAIAEWVQGFLGGFGMVNTNLSQASEDVQELINDFASIAQISLDFEDDDMESVETAFYEVVEYVRMGVIYCFGELADTPEEQPTLH